MSTEKEEGLASRHRDLAGALGYQTNNSLIPVWTGLLNEVRRLKQRSDDLDTIRILICGRTK